MLSPELEWILVPGLVDCQLKLAPLPVHFVVLRDTVLEPLVEQLWKLNHVNERVGLVGKLEDWVVLRVLLVSANA